MTSFITSYIDLLMNVSLFAHIEADELERILVCLVPRIREYDKGEFITMEGHEFEGIGVVVEGKATVTKTNEAGERIIMMQMGKGGVFGEMVAFSSINQWPATVIAMTPCKVLSLKPDAIINHCQNMCVGHKQLMLNLLEIISNKALGLNRKVNYLSIKSMRGKLAKFLYEEYSKKEKVMFEIPFNRNELAEFLHVSRPSMSRELGRMKDEGLIDYHQSTFKLLDVEAISDYASHLN